MSEDPNGEPLVLQIGDCDSPFIPLPPSKLLMNVTEDAERIDALFDKVYNMFNEDYYSQGRHGTSVATGSAMQAAT